MKGVNGEVDRIFSEFSQILRQELPHLNTEAQNRVLADLRVLTEEHEKLGNSPIEITETMLFNAQRLNQTTGDGFFCDLQILHLADKISLYCLQLPGGGSVYLLKTPEGVLMIDTGYGIFQKDITQCAATWDLDLENELKLIITTHGDADHCGAAGGYNLPTMMHPITREIIRCGNRAFGSKNESWIVEQIYTTMIAVFSHWNPPREENIHLFSTEKTGEMRGDFPVIDTVFFGGILFEILECHGGHQAGQVFLFSPNLGLIFTADTLMNFTSLTEDRKTYNSIADFLVTSVNVDSELARKERKSISAFIQSWQKETGRQMLLCCGHGAVSKIVDDTMIPCREIIHYTHT